MTIITGLVVSKIRPNWSKSMDNLVNIPELYLAEAILNFK